MYYLQSRYYDPTTCRFINADAYASTGQGLLGFNMFAYCLNNPTTLKDSQGSFSECCYDEILDLDDPDNKDRSGYAYAQNPIDTGYSYYTDLTVGSNTSFTGRGLYGSGYSSGATYSPPGGATTGNTQYKNSNSAQLKNTSHRHTPDQQALIELLKPYKQSGISMSEARIAVEWAKEYGFANSRIDLGHENGGNDVTKGPHLHVGPLNHIKIY